MCGEGGESMHFHMNEQQREKMIQRERRKDREK